MSTTESSDRLRVDPSTDCCEASTAATFILRTFAFQLATSTANRLAHRRVAVGAGRFRGEKVTAVRHRRRVPLEPVADIAGSPGAEQLIVEVSTREVELDIPYRGTGVLRRNERGVTLESAVVARRLDRRPEVDARAGVGR